MKIVMLLLKILKYILKYTLIPLSIIALVYFRAVIFQADINQYLDAGLSIAEDNLNFKIPAYAKQEQKVEIAAQVQCEPVVKDDAIASSTEKVEPELVADAPVDTGIIEELTAAANAINEKVEMLFDEEKKAASVVESEQIKDNEVDVLSTAKLDTDNEIIDVPDQAAPLFDTAPVDSTQQLMLARELFWNGNVSESEQAYLKLIDIDGTNPDVYGELGNVYYAQGKRKLAGESYYEAAVRLVELKKVSQVNYLLRVIQGLDAHSAEKLKNKISG